tara:strand:+ start:1654 stop:1845 length:192 start_codon:yes stop_codon:yes gene_type:complete
LLQSANIKGSTLSQEIWVAMKGYQNEFPKKMYLIWFLRGQEPTDHGFVAKHAAVDASSVLALP